MGQMDDLLSRGDRAEDIGHVCKRDQFRALGQKRLVFVQIEQTIFGHRDEFEPNTPFIFENLPGHQI